MGGGHGRGREHVAWRIQGGMGRHLGTTAEEEDRFVLDGNSEPSATLLLRLKLLSLPRGPLHFDTPPRAPSEPNGVSRQRLILERTASSSSRRAYQLGLERPRGRRGLSPPLLDRRSHRPGAVARIHPLLIRPRPRRRRRGARVPSVAREHRCGEGGRGRAARDRAPGRRRRCFAANALTAARCSRFLTAQQWVRGLL